MFIHTNECACEKLNVINYVAVDESNSEAPVCAALYALGQASRLWGHLAYCMCVTIRATHVEDLMSC